MKNKYSLELSEEAYDDLVHIQHYTYSQFGEAQWAKYSNQLDEALHFIIEEPYAGFVRNDLPKRYLTWPIGKHIIIYRISGKQIFVVRVLHERMNFSEQF